MSDIHQKLMDKAYDDERIRADKHYNGNWSYNRMLNKASDVERFAVVLGNWNYQVENGGINQWVDNGYCTGISDLREALEKMDTKHSNTIIKYLDEVQEYLLDEVISGLAESCGCGGNYYDDDKCGYSSDLCYECGGSGEVENPEYDWDDEECEEDEMIECCECSGTGEVEDSEADVPDFQPQSYQYYEFNNEFMKECEVFLQSELNKMKETMEIVGA